MSKHHGDPGRSNYIFVYPAGTAYSNYWDCTIPELPTRCSNRVKVKDSNPSAGVPYHGDSTRNHSIFAYPTGTAYSNYWDCIVPELHVRCTNRVRVAPSNPSSGIPYELWQCQGHDVLTFHGDPGRQNSIFAYPPGTSLTNYWDCTTAELPANCTNCMLVANASPPTYPYQTWRCLGHDPLAEEFRAREKAEKDAKELEAKMKAEQKAKEVGPVDIDKIVAERVAQELEKVKLAGAGKVESKVRPLAEMSEAQEVELLSKASATLLPLGEEDDEFWAVVKEFKASVNNTIDDYNSSRTRRDLEPLTFVVTAVQKVKNELLESRFERCRQRLAAAKDPARTAAEMKERVGFHGTRAPSIKKICDKGLLRVGHPLNPSESVDDGFFGVPTKGVYLSRHPDYCLKYSHQLAPLDEGEQTKILMFKLLPGRSRHIEKRTPGLTPADSSGFDSHSSSNFQEWYLFSEEQCVPTHVLTVRAIINRRHGADDD